jgi:hypothetical protein
MLELSMMKNLPRCSPSKKTNNNNSSRMIGTQHLDNNKINSKSTNSSSKKPIQDYNSSKTIWDICSRFAVEDSISCN